MAMKPDVSERASFMAAMVSNCLRNKRDIVPGVVACNHGFDCWYECKEKLYSRNSLVPRTVWSGVYPWCGGSLFRTYHDNGVIREDVRKEAPTTVWERITRGFGTECITLSIVCED
ncbi:hypothetical protein BOTCAL_0351g00030 [Botryotinia calthae]|uniref:Uncharacterized protein n=1 Tax=Botryotinia calthae TaxID=38488 RepID=A0A4Y8CSJ0_9HELO|nr:hypothetical protein BOTCAL_0351g00030 [Botryotinia calthae]